MTTTEFIFPTRSCCPLKDPWFVSFSIFQSKSRPPFVILQLHQGLLPLHRCPPTASSRIGRFPCRRMAMPWHAAPSKNDMKHRNLQTVHVVQFPFQGGKFETVTGGQGDEIRIVPLLETAEGSH